MIVTHTIYKHENKLITMKMFSLVSHMLYFLLSSLSFVFPSQDAFNISGACRVKLVKIKMNKQLGFLRTFATG